MFVCLVSVLFILGSWHTRGHTSTLGIGVVIDAHSGIALDYEVLSKTCQTCASMRTKLKKNKITKHKYRNWRLKHQQACCLNYEGSSGGMEETAAKLIWLRSITKTLRYTTFIGDGYCSTHKVDCQLNDGDGPYGPDNIVEKDGCVNHFHKRMGTALR